ncbi:MAG: hypothetical protein GXO69_06880, partial [Acidobacteria bacterium]|nr:hypothetical protein [Acidobacteriota bacterium]
MKSGLMKQVIIIVIGLCLGLFATATATAKTPSGIKPLNRLFGNPADTLSAKPETTATKKPVKLPKTASRRWWAKAQQNIHNMEYNANKAVSSDPLIGKAVQAPNRAQNFRTWFLSDRIVVCPRTDK